MIEQLRSNRDLLYRTIRTSPILKDRLRVYGGQGDDLTQAAVRFGSIFFRLVKKTSLI